MERPVRNPGTWPVKPAPEQARCNTCGGDVDVAASRCPCCDAPGPRVRLEIGGASGTLRAVRGGGAFELVVPGATAMPVAISDGERRARRA